jgi:hypothetical protein
MSGYTKLFRSLVTSTIWREDLQTKVVWITMLALADKHGVVEASVPGLADMARISVEACREALGVLLSPDPDSRTQDFEGRRIAPVDGGWRILNYVKYREKMRSAERAEYLAQKKRESRARLARKSVDVNNVNQFQPIAEAEAEAESSKDYLSSLRSESVDPFGSTMNENGAEKAKKPPTKDPELDWRIEEVWSAFCRERDAFFRQDIGYKAPPVGLTPEIRTAIRQALLVHDAQLLGPNDRDEWKKRSSARAAGIGLFLSPWHTGTDKDNDVRDGGKRYLEPWRPWKRQRGKPDPVPTFAGLYFEAKEGNL